MQHIKPRLHAPVLLLLACGALAACGRSRNSDTGALSDAGGANAGDGANGGAAAESTSKAEACIAYMTAECRRRAECEGTDPGDCFAYTASCPDATFAPGSTATVAGLLACADAYATFSCDAVNYYQVPPCAPAGTIDDGAHCDFSVQCASQTCVGSPCGTCAKSVGLGEACTAEGVTCASGLYCGPQAKCAEPDPNAPPEEFGEACAGDIDCPQESFCSLAAGSNTGTCRQYPGDGDACTVEPCRDGTFCGVDATCHPLPGEGEACGDDALSGAAFWCMPGLFCSPGATPAEGTCRTPQSEEEPCVMDARGIIISKSCGAGLHCDATVSPPLCKGAHGVGESCAPPTGSVGCQSGAECDDDWICRQIVYAGGRCDDPLRVCHPAFTCTDGACVPREPQNDPETCTP